MAAIDSRAADVLDRQAQLDADRSVWEQHWREIAERILPRQNDFQKSQTATGGQKRTERIFDSTAVLALDRAASAIDSLLTPATQQWHGLEPEDPSLLQDKDTMVYLAEVAKLLFRMRYRPSANFASQAHECYVSLMAFGTQSIFVDDHLGIGTRYKSIALPELYIAENHAGVIDYVHRKFPMSVRAAMQKWPTGLPDTITKLADKAPFQKFNFVHCVRPNDEYKSSRRDARGMQWTSLYVSEEGRALVSAGGYRTMPYATSRHVTAPRETYGRSPAMMVLPDIKMVNEMEKTIIRAAHKIVDPPLLMYGDGMLSAFSTRPGALNYGGVDPQGNQLVHPMKMGSNLPIALDMTEQKRKVINDAFYVTLFQILVQNPQMTATEALIRAQEKGQLLAPTVGRQQSEFLGPMIERELDIAVAAHALPEMPPALMAAGGRIKVVYTSPLSRLRRAEDGVAIMRTIEALVPLAQSKPEIMDVFDETELAYELAEINGVPAKVLLSRDALTAKRQQAQQDQQEQMAWQNAQSAAGAGKDLAQAAQAAGFTQPATRPNP